MSKPTTIFNVLVGLCDALTGLALLFIPKFVLSVLGTEVVPESLVYIRYIGVFVLAVGAIYFVPYLSTVDGKTRENNVLYNWRVTALIRTLVALFVVSQLIVGSLSPQWLVVAITDGSIAVVQLLLIKNQNKENH